MMYTMILLFLTGLCIFYSLKRKKHTGHEFRKYTVYSNFFSIALGALFIIEDLIVNTRLNPLNTLLAFLIIVSSLLEIRKLKDKNYISIDESGLGKFAFNIIGFNFLLVVFIVISIALC